MRAVIIGNCSSGLAVAFVGCWRSPLSHPSSSPPPTEDEDDDSCRPSTTSHGPRRAMTHQTTPPTVRANEECARLECIAIGLQCRRVRLSSGRMPQAPRVDPGSGPGQGVCRDSGRSLHQAAWESHLSRTNKGRVSSTSSWGPALHRRANRV